MRLSTTLFVAVAGLAVAELATFAWVGDRIGVASAVLLGMTTSVLGIALISHQGRSRLLALRRTVLAGGSPAAELTKGAFVLVAGILLVLPGFLTDVAGLLLLLPPVRAVLWQTWRRRRDNRVEIL